MCFPIFSGKFALKQNQLQKNQMAGHTQACLERASESQALPRADKLQAPSNMGTQSEGAQGETSTLKPVHPLQ